MKNKASKNLFVVVLNTNFLWHVWHTLVKADYVESRWCKVDTNMSQQKCFLLFANFDTSIQSVALMLPILSIYKLLNNLLGLPQNLTLLSWFGFRLTTIFYSFNSFKHWQSELCEHCGSDLFPLCWHCVPMHFPNPAPLQVDQVVGVIVIRQINQSENSCSAMETHHLIFVQIYIGH